MSKIVASVISGRWEWEEGLAGQRGARNFIFHYKPWVLFKLCASITLGKIKIHFKNPKIYLVNDTQAWPCFAKFDGIPGG